VQATLAQPYTGPVTTLTLNTGQTLTGAGTHPIMTPTGAVQLASLTVGQQVYTGSTTVASVTSITSSQMSGGLFNLWLDASVTGDTTFLANGILVGDYQMQVALIDASENNLSLAKAKLPSNLHTDFDSCHQDLAAKANSKKKAAR
jgi:D-aminopeptidase